MFDHVALNAARFAVSAPVYRQLLGRFGRPVLEDAVDLLEWEVVNDNR